MKYVLAISLFITLNVFAKDNCSVFIDAKSENPDEKLQTYMVTKLKKKLREVGYHIVQKEVNARFYVDYFSSACVDETEYRCLVTKAEIYLVDKELAVSYKMQGDDTEGFFLGASEKTAFKEALIEMGPCTF